MLEKVAGKTALVELPEMYRSFFKDPSRHFLTVLGRPRTGKRWHLKTVLAELGIESEWYSGSMDTLLLGNALSSGKTVILYELTCTLFGDRKQREMLLSAIRDTSGGNTGKVLILDDPYTKRTSELSEALDGIEYSFTVDDFLHYIAHEKDSIAKAHAVEKRNIEQILGLYLSRLEKGIIQLDDKGFDFSFSVSGVISCAKAMQTDLAMAHLCFPQELRVPKLKAMDLR